MESRYWGGEQIMRALLYVCTLLLSLGLGAPAQGEVGTSKNSPVGNFKGDDMKLMQHNTDEALDSSEPNARREWNNPKTGASGFAQVKGQFIAAEGMLCKRLLIGNQAKGIHGEGTHTLCKVEGRGWLINDGAEPASSDHK
jgi:hypothetical protein